MIGTIERRVLVSYRADPDVVARLLPSSFRPHVRDGSALVGICCLRLRDLRPGGLPASVGITTENVAHRFAVERDGERGVYVPRRDTSGRMAAVAGGRAFPGPLRHGRFRVVDANDRIELDYSSDDAAISIAVHAVAIDRLTTGSTFATVEEASTFFRGDVVGWSPPDDAVQLRVDGWNVAPLAVERIRSSFFDDERRFPAGSIQLDSAVVMRNLAACWATAQAA